MKLELPEYPGYQAAESDWIGRVPRGWDVLPFKRLCSRVDVGIAEAATHAYTETGVPIIRGTNVRANRLEGEILFIEPWFAEKNRSKYMRAGDLVTVRTGYPGVTTVIPEEFDMSQCFTLIISTPKKGQNSQFYSYFFNSICGMAHFAVHGWGSAQTNISVPIVQEMLVPFPPVEQQQDIVTFLDRETAKIDRLMEVRRKQVGLLQEQRTAVIHHAVAKGLDPHSKMKPSGVEWLGDVPAHWEVWKISRAFRQIGSGTTPPVNIEAYYRDGVNIWINTGDLNDSIVLDSQMKLSNLALATLKVYPAGSILVAMYGATIGKVGLLGVPACVNQACCVLGQAIKTITEYTFYWFLTHRNAIVGLSYGGGQPNISQQTIRSLNLTVPPRDEQQTIVDHIRRQTAKLDTLIGKYQRELELLSEYRASLICHAVTGKIDVRNLVARAEAAESVGAL